MGAPEASNEAPEASNAAEATEATEETKATEASEASEAEAVAAKAEENERMTALLSMGFDEEQVRAALDASHGSLERAADWLFVTANTPDDTEASQDAFPQVPVESVEIENVPAEPADVAPAAIAPVTPAEHAAALGLGEDLSESMMADIAATLEAQPSFDEAWAPLVGDLQDMGFSEGNARQSLIESKGDFKEAVRLLVREERSQKSA